MGEFFDYLMNSVESCYQKLPKTQPNAPTNPLSVWQGKTTVDTVCKYCAICVAREEKDCSLQGCFLSLTSLVYPVTGIWFEQFSYDVCVPFWCKS